MAIHFISDLHLADDTPALNQLFLDTLAVWRGRIDALYILGDLFEYWVGDDDDSPYLDAPLAAMRDFAAQTPLYVMRGNRDFLLGAGFEARSGAKLLDDPTLIEAHGQRILLSHGDALCADDAAYQQFRAMSRSPQWQQAMLAKPLAERHAIARHARAQSEMNKQQTGLTAISDVTENAVRALLAAHGWPTLIHGHTHRPAHHRHDAASRWVIQDWHGATGGYLLLDDAGIHARNLSA
ncbi:UDP-2,3-diacylglucosamine diphosphatase [Chromobacterium paludis]|uniref:UDP-2,3-diacylglucosamine hydrolase n=1 Tax=Chromobacterium paludis TaxID=2605945 RepID=A0A5C1DIN6_9NEIS|nr:UDP-2,3-diacylglucosamine diphosphatase [Chromobacterium paludis]QEL55907.1 UDP-2,3-diacylglucosamine diphosphatase [Chromobacterium paludis]